MIVLSEQRERLGLDPSGPGTPCFISMRCKANHKVNADGDPRPFNFFYYSRHNQGTGSCDFLDLHKGIDCIRGRTLNIKKRKNRVKRSMDTVSGRLRRSGNDGSRFMQSHNLVFRANAGWTLSRVSRISTILD